jgi:adenylate cyclase
MTEERAKRKLTAILSADVKGYSRLMGEDEVATVATLKKYREIISSLVDKHSGRVVDSPGDNLLAEFGSVVDAVECAVTVQKILKDENATLPEGRRMEFRIGVNLGDVIDDDGRIYGDGVNVAARVEGLADGGGICISGTAFDQIGKKLTLGYEFLGEQTVKNIEKPVRVYKVLTESEAVGKVIGEERPKPKQWRWAAFGAVAVLIIVAAVLAIWNFYLRPSFEPASVERMAFSLPDKPSIAVLPFDNLSGDSEQEYFSDGLTENIITGLSKIPEMFVIARNSTFTYKEKPVKVQQVAEDLGVRYVLEGSVQKSGEQLRVTAQLVDALKGYHVWSETYDRKMEGLFAVQDDITLNIAVAMQVKLTEGEQARVRHSTDNLKAWALAVRAHGLFETYRKDDNAKARELFKKAIELDSNYTYAWTYLGWTHWVDGKWHSMHYNQKESFERAAEMAQKALSIDDNSSDAYALLSGVYLVQSKYDEAVAVGKKAIALDPNSSENHAIVAITMQNVGDGDAVIGLIKQAMRLDPYFPPWYWFRLGIGYRMVGRYEESVEALKKRIEISEKANKQLYGLYLELATTYSIMNRLEEAKTIVAKALEINPKISCKSWGKALVYKDPAQTELILEALRKAGLPETQPLPLPDKPSIAVLPFTNMSEDAKQEYFSDGITEEIITALSKIPKLFVIARTSSFKYKGKKADVRMVGRELGVRYVLEGSVRKSGEKLRITAQLIDAQTNQHLWAERYDRDLKEIFAIQDEITMKIITALQVKLTTGDPERLYSKGTSNLAAYLKCLQARELIFGAVAKKEENMLARRLAQEAINLDPNYSEAYRELAATYVLDVWLRMSKSPRVSLERAVELAQKAIALDNSNAHAYSLLAEIYVMLRQYDKAVAAVEHASALAPNSSQVLFRYGRILYLLGRFEEALPYFEEAMRFNPLPPNSILRRYGMLLRALERYDEAIALFKKTIEEDPKRSLFSYLALAVTYSLAGREEEARETAKEVLRINPRFSVKHWEKITPMKDPTCIQRTASAMRKAGLPD